MFWFINYLILSLEILKIFVFLFINWLIFSQKYCRNGNDLRSFFVYDGMIILPHKLGVFINELLNIFIRNADEISIIANVLELKTCVWW